MALISVTAYFESPVRFGDVLHLDGILTGLHPSVRGGSLTRESSSSEVVRPHLPVASLTFGGVSLPMTTAAMIGSDPLRSQPEFLRPKGSGPEAAHGQQVVRVPALTWLAIGSRKRVWSLLKKSNHVGAGRDEGYGIVSQKGGWPLLRKMQKDGWPLLSLDLEQPWLWRNGCTAGMPDRTPPCPEGHRRSITPRKPTGIGIAPRIRRTDSGASTWIRYSVDKR